MTLLHLVRSRFIRANDKKKKKKKRSMLFYFSYIDAPASKFEHYNIMNSAYAA